MKCTISNRGSIDNRRKATLLAAALTGVGLFSGSGTAYAATHTWSNAGATGNWSTTDANWDSGPAVAWSNDAAGDTAKFVNASTLTATIPNAATIKVGTLSFAGSATGTINNAGAGTGMLEFVGTNPTITGTSTATWTLSARLVGTNTNPIAVNLPATATVNLSNNNVGSTYAGGWNFNSGTVQLNSNKTVLGALNAPLTFNGGTLKNNINNIANTDITTNSRTVTIASGGATITGDYGATFANGIGNNGTGSLTVKMTNNVALTLQGVNTYTGGTNFNGGIASINSLAALGSATGPLSFNGGTLTYATGFSGSTDISAGRTVTLTGSGGTINTNGNDVTFANSIGNSGAGSLTKDGAGTLALGAAPTYTGATTVKTGTLSVAALGNGALNINTTLRATGTLSTSGAVTVQSANSTIEVDANKTVTLTGKVSGSGGYYLTKTGEGTLVLGNTVDNAQPGTILNGGTLKLASSSKFESYNASMTVNAGTWDLNGKSASFGLLSGTGGLITGTSASTMSTGDGVASGSTTYSGVIAGSMGILMRGGGYTLALAGSDPNTFTGPTYVVHSDATSKLVLNKPSGVNAIGGDLSIGYAPGGFNSAYGYVQLNASGQIPVTCNLSMNGYSTSNTATFDLNTTDATIRTLNDNGQAGSTHIITNNGLTGSSSVLTVTNGGTFNGVLKDGVNGRKIALTVAGGTMTLASANNTYTGPTKVAQGTLTLTAAGTIANSTALILGDSSGGTTGTLDVTAKATSFAQSNVSGKGTLKIGSGKTISITGLAPGFSIGEIDVIGNLALAGTTAMELGGAGEHQGIDFDNTTVSGALTYGGSLSIASYNSFDIDGQKGTYSLFDFASQSGSLTGVSVGSTNLSDIDNDGVWTGTNSPASYSFSMASGDLTVTIPEPVGLALAALSSVGILARRRRRQA